LKIRPTKDFLLLCAAFLLTAALLTVIGPPITWAPLAWIALVPFILASSPKAKPRSLALAAYLLSLAYWLVNLYWIAPITAIGWFAVCAYFALLWPILALTIRYCRAKKIPLLIAVPILIVGAERLQGVFLGGFFWRLLAHSQFQNIPLIQIADIFGAAGVSFLIAMTNALIAEFALTALKSKKPTAAHLAKAAVVAAALIATITYGKWRIAQSERFIKPGPVVGSVQSNIPQSVKISGEASDVILDKLINHSLQAAAAGAQLILWPETMVQATLNERVWPYIYRGVESRAYHEKIAQHAKNNAFILVGAYGGQMIFQENGTLRTAKYNSAFLYKPDGTQDTKWYSKIHLVMFGEVVPFYQTFPAMYRFLMNFVPKAYKYNYSLDAGTQYTVFEMTNDPNRPAQPYRFGVMICYEDTIPRIARKFANPENGKKSVDFLVNISNDGWFVRFTNGKTIPTTELAQHTAICTFRAVENRLAVVRSVNTGISCIIDSLGRITDGYTAGDLPQKALRRTGMAGWFVDRLPIDKRITLFSKYGQWLDFCCAACLIAFMILPMIPIRLKPKPRYGKLRGKN